MKMTKKALLVSSAMVAFAASPACAEADNAPAPRQEAARSDEIIVTAQKREERLLDVPSSITAVNAEDLSTQNFNRLSDFFDRVPGVQFSGQRVTQVSIRGITTGGNTNPTVAILVDDVQFGGSTLFGQPPLPDFDPSLLERIEVLRGPQGSLYGASSLGGLIKYVLKSPDTKQFSGRVEVGGTSVSNGGEGYSARAAINVPITEWLAVNANIYKRDDPAYLDNASSLAAKSRDVNTRKAWGFRGAVLVKPTNDMAFTFSALRHKNKALNSDLSIASGGVPICRACTPGFGDSVATAVTTFEPVYGDLTLNSADSFNHSTFSLYTARGQISFGDIELTSISAWSRADNSLLNDVSNIFGGLFRPVYGAPANSFVQIANNDLTTKFSQELRVGQTGAMFDWMIGGFYTVEHSTTEQTFFLKDVSGSVLATPYSATGPLTYRERAVFGNLTWHATDKLDVQFGGRYARNKQTVNSPITVDGPVEMFFGETRVSTGASKDDAFTWAVSPSYHISRDLMVYARVATGYRPGVPNVGYTPVPSASSDTVINYELGFKGRVIPDVLTVDAALFQIDWKDIHLQNTDAVTQQTFLTNGSKARSRGLELSASLTPWRGMKADFNLTLNSAKLTQDLPDFPDGLAGNKGDRLPFSAKATGSISLEQTFELSPSLQALLGGTFVSVGNRPSGFLLNAPQATRPRIFIPGYSVADIRAGLTYDQAWTLTAFVRNLFDERGVATAQNRNGTGVPTAIFIQPRTFGITLARTF